MQLYIINLHNHFVMQENPHCLYFFFSMRKLCCREALRESDNLTGVVCCTQAHMRIVTERGAGEGTLEERGLQATLPSGSTLHLIFSLIQDVVTHSLTYTLRL